MNPENNTLFVHNTMSGQEDILAAQSKIKNLFWATCPNANLYIENRLPNYKTFMDCNAQVTIGTDSLTSNWQLSVMAEIYAIQKYCSYVPLETCITWATYNGAKALGYDEFGSIEIGKSPGLILADIERSGEKYRLNSSAVRRLI
jgi:cytosine/adenosine deaminase-related metal-dependent hydrolase